MGPLKHLSTFWTTFEMALVNCEVTLDLDWPENCVICEADRTAAFSISSTKLYVTVVTLSTHAVAKLLQQ